MNQRYILTGGVQAFLIKEGSPVHLRYISIDEIKPTEGRATLREMVGLSSFLANFPKGCQIDLTYREHGRLDSYESEQVIIRLTNCKLIDDWILKPVINNPGDQDPLQLYALLSCSVEVIDENS